MPEIYVTYDLPYGQPLDVWQAQVRELTQHLVASPDDAVAELALKMLRREVAAFKAAGDRPGHEFHGNQWTDGISSSNDPSRRETTGVPSQRLSDAGVTDALRMRLSGPEEVNLAQNLQVLRGAATRLDFPAEQVVIKSYDRNFEIAGQRFDEAGHFDPYSGEIVFRAETLATHSSVDAEAMFTHEVTHRDWHDVSEALGLEEGDSDPVPDVSNLPIAQRVTDIYTEQGDVLQREDGVSEYSRAHWRAVPHGEDAADDPSYDRLFNTAVNETLAEISKGDLWRAFGRHQMFDPTPTWRKLHTDVKEIAKEIRRIARLNDVGAPTK